MVSNLILILMMSKIYNFEFFNTFWNLPKKNAFNTSYASVWNRISLCSEWFRKYISGLTKRGGTSDAFLEYPLIQDIISKVHIFYNYYKYGPLSHTKTHYTIININWHVTYVYFNGVKPSIEFKFNEYTPLANLK